jgi:hypothetical protein
VSQTQAVFLRADGSAELRSMPLNDKGLPPPRVLLSRRAVLSAVPFSKCNEALEVSHGKAAIVEAASFVLTDEGIDYPIYREEVKP